MATERRGSNQQGQGRDRRGGDAGVSEGHPDAIDRRQRQRGDQVLANRKPQSATVADEPQSFQQQVRPPRGAERTSLDRHEDSRSEPNKAHSPRGPSSLRPSDVPDRE